MRALEREQDRFGGEAVERAEEVEAEERAFFVPLRALATSAGGEEVLRAGDVGAHLVGLVEERRSTREEAAEIARAHAPRRATVRAACVVEVVMCELVTENERELRVHQHRLTSDLAAVCVRRRIDEALLRPRERLLRFVVLRDERRVLIELVRLEELVVSAEARRVRHHLEERVADRHERLPLVVARSERVDLTDGGIRKERDGGDLVALGVR